MEAQPPSEEWEELLGSGVRRRVVVEGGGASPDLGSLVLFNWRGCVLQQEGGTGPAFAERTKATARIGDGDEIPGLELALRHMRGGQQCLVRCESRFAYGPDGCPATRPGDVDLPPNADIELHVELLEVLSNTAPSNMTPKEALAEGQRRKVVGNDLFGRKAYKKALRSYTSAHNAIAELEFPDHDSDLYREAWQFRVDCGNNIATSCVRMGELKRAKDAVVGVLELDPVNVKALFRAGQICSLESNFVEAKLALRKALDLNPESKEVQAELHRLSARIKAHNTKRQAMQEAMGRSMFGGVKGERQVSHGNGNGIAVGANAALEVPQIATTARQEAEDTDVRRPGVDLSEDPGRKPIATTLALERCQAVSMCALVALAAWGVMYLVAR